MYTDEELEKLREQIANIGQDKEQALEKAREGNLGRNIMQVIANLGESAKSLGGGTSNNLAVNKQFQAMQNKKDKLALSGVVDKQAALRQQLKDKLQANRDLTNENRYQSNLNRQIGQEKESKRRFDEQMKLSREKFDQQKKESALQQEFRKNELNRKLKEKLVTPKLSEGEKVTDREFAKDYNAWSSGDNKVARNEINKLRNVVNDIKKGSISLGRENALIPDFVADYDRLKARSDVHSSIMKTLRATLGAQFTEKEGDRILKATWNENDSEENNIARLDRLISDLSSKADAKDEKAKYFQQSGTLRGFSPDFSAPEKPRQERATIERRDPKSGRIVIYDAETKQPIKFKE